MELYIDQITRVLDNDNLNQVEKEKRLRTIQNALMTAAMQEAINRKESELERKDRQSIIDRRYERTVQFSFGAITYTRTAYIKGKKTHYPVDQWLGVQRNKRNSQVFEYYLTQIVAFMTYRKCSLVLELLTGMTVSKDTFGKLVKKYGEKKESQMKYEKEFPKDINEEDKKRVPVLFIEGDGTLVDTQGVWKSKDKARGKKEIAVFAVHEGVRKVSNTRKETINLKVIADVSYADAKRRFVNYLYETYDLSHTLVVVNSDGGKGYTKRDFKEMVGIGVQMEYFIDRYHVSLKLKQRIFVEDLIEEFQKAINAWDKVKLQACLDTFEGFCETPEQMEQHTLLKAYLHRHWKNLKPLCERGIQMKKEGIGIMESQLRIFTYRMKRQGKAWGAGMQGMINIIASYKNKDYEEVFFEKWEKDHELDNQLKAEDYRINVTDVFEPHVGVIQGKLNLETLNMNKV